jgi:pimeloyl-ACP methyl ester carboxylesterase
VRGAIDTVTHGVDYTRHWAHGNRVTGEMSWIRSGAPPVVLVHGFLGTRGTMVPMTRRLREDGRVVFSYAYGTFNLDSIRASAQRLTGQLRQIVDRLGAPCVDMVGFSQGGLIALHAIKFMQAHRFVRRVATLGSPLRGTRVALAGVATLGMLSPSVWQMLPGSSFLSDLRSAPLPPGVRMRQIHAASDAFVPAPGPIEGVAASDYILLPGGHSSLVVAPHFFEAVREFLDAELPEVAATPVVEDPDRLAVAPF